MKRRWRRYRRRILNPLFWVQLVVMATAVKQDEQQTGRLTLAHSESLSTTLGQRLVDS